MLTTIRQKDDPVLRAIALPVEQHEFGTAGLAELIAQMSSALAREEDGIALAAPQVGVGKRLFIVSARLFAKEGAAPGADLVFANPELVKLSRRRVECDEGCLSVRWYYGKTRRAERATVVAHDAAGQRFTRQSSGLLAQIFQHEIDHLDGVLFIDHATALEEVPPPHDCLQT